MVRFSGRGSNNSGVLILSVCFLVVGAFALGKAMAGKGGANSEIVVAQAPAAPPQEIQIQVATDGDGRFNRAPKPERDWLARPDMDAVRNSGYNLPVIATR